MYPLIQQIQMHGNGDADIILQNDLDVFIEKEVILSLPEKYQKYWRDLLSEGLKINPAERMSFERLDYLMIFLSE